MRDVWPGRWQPLGAAPDAGGTNFAVYSRHAQGVTLCLFDDAGYEEQLPLSQSTHHVWHAYLPGVGPGTRYGYRVDGVFDPVHGSRFNSKKLLTQLRRPSTMPEPRKGPMIVPEPPTIAISDTSTEI